jgi:outer membrane protein assembly factor BamB
MNQRVLPWAVAGSVAFFGVLIGAVSLAAPVENAAKNVVENWPQFRGPTADGQCGNPGVPLTWSDSLNVVWKTPIHGRGWSSPVVWGSQVWLTTATPDGKQMFAVCVDRRSGQIIHDVKIFDVQKPEEIHELNSYASPTPVIEEGRVYVHFGSYGTACLNSTSAEVLWTRRDLPCNHFRGPGSSPMLFGDLLVVHLDGFDFQYVVALDRNTGKTVWKTDRSVPWGNTDGDFKKAYSTPLLVEVDGRLELVSSGSKAAMAYDPATGRELWKIRYDGFSSTARPLFGCGLVFINTGFGKADLYAVRPGGSGDVTDSHIAWKVTRGIGSKPSPVMVDELLYLVHDGGVALCLEAKTGKEVWSKRLGGAFSASSIVADGRVYFFSQQGATSVVKPGRKFELLATNKLPDGFMASPAVAGKSIFLRTEKALYRIEE